MSEDIMRFDRLDEYQFTNDFVADSIGIIESSRRVAQSGINLGLIRRNWLLGKRIDEEELKGGDRSSTYGKHAVVTLSKKLNAKYGGGYSKTSLYQFVKFYRYFPEIIHVASGKSPLLTWTHYRELLREHDSRAHAWYEREAYEQTWSVETLSRNISTQYYHRLLSNGVNPDAACAEEDWLRATEADTAAFIKSPVVAEFLGLSNDPELHESQLEGAIISHLQQFLLEMGKGYAFVARQQHVRTEWSDFYIDLVFYNYILKCFVLIDLKVGKITHQDVGQMDMYVRMYDELKRGEGDGPTLGIVLCSETDEDIARYSMLKGNDQLFAAKYKLYIPTEDQLRAEIEEQKRLFAAQHESEGEMLPEGEAE